MAHKLTEEVETIGNKKVKRFKVPEINGKFGVALFLGGKEVFIGVAVSSVEIEHVIKRRLLQSPKAGVKTFNFDPLT